MSAKLIEGLVVVQFQYRGVRVHRVLSQGAKLSEGKELEVKLRREIFESRDLGKKPVVSLPAAIQMWIEEQVAGGKSERTTRIIANLLAPYVIGKSIAQIPEVADTVRAACKKQGLKQSTINNRMCVFKAVARFCWEKQWQENLSNRIALPDPNNKRHRYLDGVSEVKKLMAKMESPEGKAWVAILASTGLRANELLSVGNVEGCYVRDNIIYLPPQETKGKEPRAIPVAKLGVPYLKFLPMQRNYWSMYWEVKKACKAAGIKNFKQHDIRHTYASLLVDKDVDLYVIGALLGHKCAQTTARYTHLKVDKLKQAVAKLAA